MKIFKIISLCAAAIGLICAAALATGDAARGKALFNDPKLSGGTAGRSCNTCHADGKGMENAWSRQDLAQVINTCIVNALKGKPLDRNSADMADLIAYLNALRKR
jgi:cytochrome c peroxidase